MNAKTKQVRKERTCFRHIVRWYHRAEVKGFVGLHDDGLVSLIKVIHHDKRFKINMVIWNISIYMNRAGHCIILHRKSKDV
jgi:hypothetical protein